MNFIFHTTADGSPTLSFETGGEKMHSLQGAHAETCSVYGRALLEGLSRGLDLRLMSVGLGLGYIEIMTAALLTGQARPLSRFVSFEAEPELRDFFLAWLQEKGPCPPEFQKSYEDILSRMARCYEGDPVKIRSTLRQWHEEGRWSLRGALRFDTEMPTSTIIYFDAFSRKTSPDLWTEEFLRFFLEKYSASNAIFATYASHKPLKKALQTCGFQLLPAAGFAEKRESTLALRKE